MSPPVSAALALLGLWILLIFVVTNATGRNQLRATRRSEPTEDETHAHEQRDRSP